MNKQTFAKRVENTADGMYWSVFAAIVAAIVLGSLFLLQGCQTDLGLVAKSRFEGHGVIAASDDWALIVVEGSADAGLYQVSSGGELRLTKNAATADDQIRLMRWDGEHDETFEIGQPLPAWTEPIMRAMLTPDDVAKLGLTWIAE